MIVRAGFEKLARFLTSPRSLDEDPKYRAIKQHIAHARAMHAPVKEHQKALEDYVCSLLRGAR